MRHIVCLGYAKCGTTMLDSVLRKSKFVATPKRRKEIKFFLPPQFPASDPYRAYLAEFFDSADTGTYTATFEASPPYCHQTPEVFRQVLERIRDTLPDVRVVVCVRHPVVRAYSHYIHNLHNFGLLGDGVFSGRQELPKKPFRKTFDEVLSSSGRLMTSYHDNLEMAYEVLGKDRVTLFFLESDVVRFRSWMTALIGEEAYADLGLGDESPSMVIPRRPVPNYSVKGDVLHAFGSRDGELVSYEGLTHPQRRAVLDSRKSWTLSIGDEEVRRLVATYFENDLRQCAALTGDTRFLDYLVNLPEPQSASLTNGTLLKSLHRIA